MTTIEEAERAKEYANQVVQICQRESNDLKASNGRYIAENAKLRENAARLEPLLEACAELANAAEDDEHVRCDLDGAVDKLAGELFKYRNPEASTKG